MKPVKSYLALQRSCAELAGLRWSSHDNSLEFSDGTTFAFAESIAEFLDGFARVRRVVHFTFIVHLLHWLRQAPNESEVADSARRRLLLLLRRAPTKSEAAESARWRLRTLFVEAGGSLRNAGAFCGRLCHDIPAAREANQVAEICQRLRAREPLSAFLGEQAHDADKFVQIVACGYDPPEAPPFDIAVFENKVNDVLKSFRDEDVIFWFKNGRAPIEENAGRALAQALPPTLAGRLASLLTRTRLTRARAWVAQLLGALSLPPRRLANQDVPIGGYADVTTRGQVDQILPSQFALDEWDFFRRYAEHELLYFRREDPHDQTRQELVVVLDQGVRTWGDVRLVLSAALLALGKQALQRGYPFLLATTAVDILDPLQVDAESLGEIVEASDWSAHPGLALERVLEQSSKKDRDIVLLTHPRNLDEEDVRAAARRLRPGARLFALTLDRHGQAELGEFKHGTPVPIRQFHVDFSIAPDAPAARPSAPAAETGGWTGAVEPIGFPFRFGVGGPIGARSFDFDLAGKHLLTAGPQGVLHLWDVGGSLVEILPRAVWQGNVLHSHPQTVIGVANGFVIAGIWHSRRLAVHYDLESRKCICHTLSGGAMVSWDWDYLPEHHCVIVPYSGSVHAGVSIDLSTGQIFATNLGGPKSRAQDAWIAWERWEVPSRHILVTHMIEQSRRESSVWVAPATGTVIMVAYLKGFDMLSGEAKSAWKSTFTPLADGQPMLRNRSIIAAQLGGLNLALLTLRIGGVQDTRLHLIRGLDGIPLGEYQIGHKKLGFRLSATGALLARQLGNTMIEISQVAGNVTPMGRTGVGGFTHQLPFVLGHDKILVFPGRHAYLLDWSSGKLKFGYHGHADAPAVEHGIRATAEDVPEPCRYDTQRWLLGASSRLLAASDRYGQLAIFDECQNLICMFFAFRTRLAGWMPDGTRFGQVSTADEVTLAHFGRALLAASR